ncbi:MAG: aminopeptidase P family protein, partial [Thermoleophilia bacterium]|nr:aminopeptidase P family protein [Thermoleophilia bacterium]
SGPSAALPAFADTPLGGPGVSPAIGQGAGWRPIQRGEPVVIDMVGSAGGYLVDQTRILSIGPLPEDMVQGYEICLGAQEVLKQVAVPGATCGAVYQQVKDWVEQKVQELGLTAYFMGAPGNQVPYIGHGIGLELDEFPFITRGSEQTLAADQVFACEPKLVFPGRGVVGVENTWHVTEQGLVPITFSSEALRVV